MQVITDLEDLNAKIAECNDALAHQSDDAMRAVFKTFRLDLSAQAPADPFSPEYRAFQIATHARITGKTYSLQNERTLFDPLAYLDRPFPFHLNSPETAGQQLQAIGFLLRALDLPSGSRIAEFGPGWGNTTLNLALVGMQVTAIDIEPNFCALIRERAARAHVAIDVVEGDFFWAESVVEPFDAAVFFECFHHCDDHMRLLRALRGAVKPGGALLIAAEPVVEEYDMPWGVRTDGEALWAMRNFGWLELGYRQNYFEAALARTGWIGERRACLDPAWANVWVCRQTAPDPLAQPRPVHRPPPAPPSPAAPSEAADALARELAGVYASTSWRLTAPLRALRRLGK